MSDAVEEGVELQLDWDKVGQIGRDGHRVVPVVLQEVDTGAVLFIGYANEEALAATLERRAAVLYSTSRNELWHKGATSGDTLEVIDVAVNCEQNSLLYRVRQQGSGVCHTKDATGQTRPTCYYRQITAPDQLLFSEKSPQA